MPRGRRATHGYVEAGLERCPGVLPFEAGTFCGCDRCRIEVHAKRAKRISIDGDLGEQPPEAHAQKNVAAVAMSSPTRFIRSPGV